MGACEFSKSAEPRLADLLKNIALWGDRAEGASGGTVQEDFAAKEMDHFAQQLISLVGSSNREISDKALLQTAEYFHQKYNAARSGGLAEGIYQQLVRASDAAYFRIADAEMYCEINETKSSLASLTLAQVFYAKYVSAISGSDSEAAYLKMAREAREQILPNYMHELASMYNFKALEAESDSQYQKFISAPSDSFLEQTFAQMANAANGRALEVLSYQVRRMSAEQKYAMIQEYQQKYDTAASGSFQETRAIAVLEILKN